MMTVGFIGMGLIGSRRAKIVQQAGHTIAFVVEPDASRRTAIQTQNCLHAASLEDLVVQGGGKADAIFVAVPHDMALKSCRWAFDQGAHVLCEKPMGLNLAQAEAIAAAAGKAQRFFGAGFNYRYLAGVSALRELIGARKLGEIYRVRLAMGHGGRPGMEKEWKLQRARAGGGALIDPGIHLVDLALHLIGPQMLKNSSLKRHFWESDVEDTCLLGLESGNTDVTIEVSLTSWRNQFGIEVYGRDGLAILTGRGGNYGTQKIEYVNRWFWGESDGRFVSDLGSDDHSFELETRAFLAHAAGAGHDGVLSTDTDGIAALRIVDQAYSVTPTF
jgi:predicted dehydrogenase